MTDRPNLDRGRSARARRSACMIALAFVVGASGCSGLFARSTPAGSRHSVRVQQPPERAAACFARNAEEHSSALAAEIRPHGNGAEVIVRVKNGVLYGTGDFQRAGSGSTASITLMVTTMGRRSDLLDALLEGC